MIIKICKLLLGFFCIGDFTLFSSGISQSQPNHRLTFFSGKIILAQSLDYFLSEQLGGAYRLVFEDDSIRSVTLNSILDASFHHLRPVGSEKPDIILRLLENLAILNERCLTNEQRGATRKHVWLIENDACAAIRSQSGLREVEPPISEFGYSALPAEKT